MKNLKKTMRSLLLAGTVLMMPLAQAQEGQRKMEKDPAARAEQRTAWMTKELSLTTEQAEKIKAIHLQHMTKLASVKEMEDEAQRKQAMMEVRKSQRTAVEAVLTPEQQARMKEIKAERKAKYQERKANGELKKAPGEGMQRKTLQEAK
jgi:Spy/CpxP family protein refolding chaperone